MKQFFKSFFSDSNDVNENTVLGVVVLLVFLGVTFIPFITPDKYYVLAGLVVSFFGLSAIKK